MPEVDHFILSHYGSRAEGGVKSLEQACWEKMGHGLQGPDKRTIRKREWGRTSIPAASGELGLSFAEWQMMSFPSGLLQNP